jgi:hypothetical protein
MTNPVTPPKKVVAMQGPETAYCAELVAVVERHSAWLSIHQLLGGMLDTMAYIRSLPTEDIP